MGSTRQQTGGAGRSRENKRDDKLQPTNLGAKTTLANQNAVDLAMQGLLQLW